jgi:hypothetical protein
MRRDHLIAIILAATAFPIGAVGVVAPEYLHLTGAAVSLTFWGGIGLALALIALAAITALWGEAIAAWFARSDASTVARKARAVVGALCLGGPFFGLLLYSVTHPAQPTPDPLPSLPVVSTAPKFVPPPPSIAAPPGQRPLISSAARFIFTCIATKQTAAQAAKQKAFLQKNLASWGDQIGFTITMADTAGGGYHITVEAKTDEAKNRFLALGVLPIVAVIYIEVQQYGPIISVVARADLPPEYQSYSRITPDLLAPPVVEAQSEIPYFLALPDNACHLI